MDSIQLLSLTGDENSLIEKQRIVRPVSLSLPKCDEPTIPFHTFCDLLSIRGFIVDEANFQTFIRETIEISFDGGATVYYSVPVYILITVNTIVNYTYNSNPTKPCNYFIKLPHEYCFNHDVPIFKMTENHFIVRVKNDQSRTYPVKLIMETHYLDASEKTAFPTTVNYNIRNVYQYQLAYISAQPETGHRVFESVFTPTLLTQGILINIPIQYLVDLKIMVNDAFYAMNYDTDSINIYGGNINNILFFGFNANESFNSVNLVGCLNFSSVSNIRITITTTPDYVYPILPVFLPYWNVISYTTGSDVVMLY